MNEAVNNKDCDEDMKAISSMIKRVFQNKKSWGTLESYLNNMVCSVSKSKEVIKILLIELKALHEKLKDSNKKMIGNTLNDNDEKDKQESVTFDPNEFPENKVDEEIEHEEKKNKRVRIIAETIELSQFSTFVSNKKSQAKGGSSEGDTSIKNQKSTNIVQKPFSCNFCQKRFAIQSKLKRHEIIHTDEKPFQCTNCKRCFNNSCSLKRHERLHTDEKPFECKTCPK